MTTKRKICVSIAVVAVLFGLVVGVVLVFPPMGKPASWTYGAGKYRLFKSVKAAHELSHLLEEEKVEEFNQQRRQGRFAGNYLDLTGLRLVGKDLKGVDLSRCVLKGCNFSGSDLRGASFKKSYIAESTFLSEFLLSDLPTPKMARRTCLEGADFTGATLEADHWFWNEFGYSKIMTRAGGLSCCRLRNTIGLPKLSNRLENILLTDDGARASVSTNDFHIRVVLEVSVPCANPFARIDQSDYPAWKAAGVDVQRLRVLPARRVEAPRVMKVVNADTNLVVVLTGPTRSNPEIASAGPVVMTDVAGASSVITDGVLWLRDNVEGPRTCTGNPVFVGPGVRSSFSRALLSPVYKEPAGTKPLPKAQRLRQLAQEEGLEELARRHGSGGRRLELTDDPEGLARIESRLRERLLKAHPELANMRVAWAGGQALGGRLVDVVQPDTNTVLALERGFATHGKVFAAGPVIVLGQPPTMLLFSQSWVEGVNGKRASISGLEAEEK